MENKPLLSLFEENELNISTLYFRYGQSIPNKKAFWERLSREEVGHAKSIRKEKEAFSAISENKFSRGVVKYVMDFVIEETKKVRQKKMTHKEALQTALRIERSMLEKKCFDLFIPTNRTVEKIFLKLNSETEKHVEILLEEMRKNKYSFEDTKR